MKMDALTIGAVGFAAFAAWAYLKPKQSTAGAAYTSSAGAMRYDDPWALSTAQKDASKGALWQNTDYLSGQAWTQPTSYANGLDGPEPVYSWSWKP